MRRSHKSIRSEIARIVGFDQLVRLRILKMHPDLKELDVKVIMCAGVLEKPDDLEMWTVARMVQVSKLSSSSVRNSRRRLLRIGYLTVFDPFSQKFGSPKHYRLTGIGQVVISSYSELMLELLEERGSGYDLFALA